MKKIHIIKNLLVVLGLLLVLLSCNEASEPPFQSDCDQDVIVSEKEYENAPKDHVVINGISIHGDCLKITFAASGCDGKSWVVKLIDVGMIAESYPVQRTLRLSVENKEMCDAFIEKEISFDIRKLQVEGNNKVSLNVAGKSILYEY